MVSLEMETFHLLDLARCSRGGVKAAGMCLAVAERASNKWLDHGTLVRLEFHQNMWEGMWGDWRYGLLKVGLQ